jgi:hypothetical protein
MIKRTLFLALCSVSCWVHADWDVPITATTDAKYYADSETRRSSVIPSVWILADYGQLQQSTDNAPKHLSVKMLNEADCGAGKMRMVSSIYYSLSMGKGDALSFSTFTSEWSRPASRSPSASIFEYLCPKKQ